MSLVLVRHLVMRLIRRKRFLGMSALASTAGLISWISGSGMSGPEATANYQVVMATVSAATLSIAVLFMSTAVMRDERDDGTLPFIFISPMSGGRFAVSSWVAGAAASALVATIGWLVGLIGLLAIGGEMSSAWAVLVLYLSAALAYSALFVPLGYLFSRSLLIGLGYVFVWEAILASAVSGLTASSVWRIAMSIWADIDQLPRDALDVLGSVEPGRWGGLATVAVLIVLGIAALAWAVRRRDAV